MPPNIISQVPVVSMCFNQQVSSGHAHERVVTAGAAGFSPHANVTDTRGAPGHEVVQLA